MPSRMKTRIAKAREISQRMRKPSNRRRVWGDYRLDLATRSSSSFFYSSQKEHVSVHRAQVAKGQGKTDLDGVRVGRSLGGVDELIGKTFRDGLDVVESGFTGLTHAHPRISFPSLITRLRLRSTHTNGQQSNSLVNPPQRRNIHRLSPDSSLGSNPGGVFTGTSVDDGVDQHLDRVGVGKEVDDFESVGDDSDGHELFTVVSAVHHQAVKWDVNRSAWVQGQGRIKRGLDLASG